MSKQVNHKHHHCHRRREQRFEATLNGAQEVPPVTTDATGTGTFLLDKKRRRLVYAVAFAGLSTPFVAAHFHLGAPGVNGPVLEPIEDVQLTADDTAGAATGVWQRLTRAEIKAIRANGVYVNVHSEQFPNGEIRGQVTALLL